MNRVYPWSFGYDHIILVVCCLNYDFPFRVAGYGLVFRLNVHRSRWSFCYRTRSFKFMIFPISSPLFLWRKSKNTVRISTKRHGTGIKKGTVRLLMVIEEVRQLRVPFPKMTSNFGKRHSTVVDMAQGLVVKIAWKWRGTVVDDAGFRKHGLQYSLVSYFVYRSTCSVLEYIIVGAEKGWSRYTSIPVTYLVQLLEWVVGWFYQLSAWSDVVHSTLPALYL